MVVKYTVYQDTVLSYKKSAVNVNNLPYSCPNTESKYRTLL